MNYYRLHRFASLLLVGAAFAGCTSGKNISFIRLTMLDHADTGIHNGSQYINKTDFYLVQNYSKEAEPAINRFVQKNKDPQLQKYAHYEMFFYKESAETNVKNIQANRRVLVRHSQENDWIFSYRWSNGKSMPRWKLIKGELVEPSTSNITITDIPDSTK